MRSSLIKSSSTLSRGDLRVSRPHLTFLTFLSHKDVCVKKILFGSALDLHRDEIRLSLYTHTHILLCDGFWDSTKLMSSRAHSFLLLWSIPPRGIVAIPGFRIPFSCLRHLSCFQFSVIQTMLLWTYTCKGFAFRIWVLNPAKMHFPKWYEI